MKTKPQVTFLWDGLPDYGARLIRGFVDLDVAQVNVVATPPSVAIQGMEKSLGQPVHWVDSGSSATWKSLGLLIPDVVFQGGWAQSSFVSLASEARQNGGKTVLMNDQNWQGGIRHWLIDPVRFRSTILREFDAVFVPGKSAVRYARMMGFKPSHIVTGLYGADPAVFHGGKALTQRPKTFQFVGQLIERKNILALVQAFQALAVDFPEWTLEICGSGELQQQIPLHPSIKIQGFVQPHALAEKLRETRCLVLPSRQEHWGLVVHEAASCGCALALSNTVGSVDDFKGEIFSPYAVHDIEGVLRRIASWSDDRWIFAETSSRISAKNFGPAIFAKSVQQIVEKLAA